MFEGGKYRGRSQAGVRLVFEIADVQDGRELGVEIVAQRAIDAVGLRGDNGGREGGEVK